MSECRVCKPEKRCRGCNTILKLSCNWNKSSYNKKDYICTPCSTLEKKKWCHKNPEKTLISCRERMRRWREKNREKNKARSRLQYYKHIDKERERSRLYSNKNRTIKNAQLAVHYALKIGKILRKPCEVCGSHAEAHHEDYSQPLDVRWLCSTHHKRIHHWVN